MEAATAKWQRGIPLETLKNSAAIFSQHDEGLILGAFSAYKENNVAEAISKGRLIEYGSVVAPAQGAAMDAEVLTRSRSVKDFTGAIRAQAQAGDGYIKRLAYTNDTTAEMMLRDFMVGRPRVWLLAWIEHEQDQDLLRRLGFRKVCTKIKASSELIGLYVVGSDPEPFCEPTPAVDEITLARLHDGLEDAVEPLAAAIAGLEYADHYSGYNLRSSWSALALRGYGGDPMFIAKPAEMSKAWKAEHPAELGWAIEDTPLRSDLPQAEPFIQALPGEPHRIRLMRLAPGGGELARHADITDPDAGMRPGQLMRLHWPVLSNDDCVFEAWRLNGTKERAIMRPGSCWYLDTRKPHTAVNGGSTERVHLVVDMAVDQDLIAAAIGAEEAVPA